MFKKRLIVAVLAIIIFGLAACGIGNGIDPNGENGQEENKREEYVEDGLEWTNENAVYADVKAEYVKDVLKDVEGAFKSLDFKKVYVMGKNIETPQINSLKLLFVLNESGAEKQQEFSDRLLLDPRINYVHNCRDIPFETVDTRRLEALVNPIAVDEMTTITFHGYVISGNRPFEFDGLSVWLTKQDENKTYGPEDFPQVKLSSVLERFDGGFCLELSEPGYFNIVKAANALSRSSKIKAVEFYFICIIPPIWEISDTTVVDFADGFDYWRYDQPATVIGKKAGTATVSLAGASIEITVV